MADVPQARVVHQTPHRVRVKIPEKRHDETYFRQATQQLSHKMPHAQVEANPTTASILVQSPQAGALLAALGGEGDPFQITEWPDEKTPQFEKIRDNVEGFNAWLRQRTGGRNDARLYIFIALLFSAAYQFARGEIMAPAATLLWYAGEALRFWAPPEKPDAKPREA